MDTAPLLSRLKKAGLRDTQPRRSVLRAITSSLSPLTAHDVLDQLKKKGDAINLVTIYRVLELLEKMHLVHRHPCNGAYSACSKPDDHGHHGFLHCSGCGKAEEFVNEDLCKVENSIAKRSKFVPTHHVSEIIGLCQSCRS